ncbi:carbohydrate ABC transporter permease [uncultured Nitratireductor sp.]|uniref:carbohydrate ABC transporter permease n=1 Tax=uncultured Nitratireductor sp. TaxID=520953 RepID=UPI002609D9B8|nr:carbohydrate ABC transporter permease [uncultured Nitratireductor sp.]
MTAITENTVTKDNPAKKRALGHFWGRVLAYVLVWAWTAFTISSIIWVILSAFKSKREVLRSGFRLPSELHWENFGTAWNVGKLGDYFPNSILLVTASVLIVLIVSAPAAYVLSRARFKGREALTNMFVLGMAIPIPMLFIPIFSLLAFLRVNDSLTGVSIVFVAISIPFTVYLLTGFFSSLPKELESAAVLDGCTDYQVFRHVMLPMATPGLATAAILNFIWLWNEYQLSLVLLNSPENRTLPLGLYALQNAMQYTNNWPGLFAGVTIIVVPTIVVYAVLSERMISGMTMGAVK